MAVTVCIGLNTLVLRAPKTQVSNNFKMNTTIIYHTQPEKQSHVISDNKTVQKSKRKTYDLVRVDSTPYNLSDLRTHRITVNVSYLPVKLPENYGVLLKPNGLLIRRGTHFVF